MTTDRGITQEHNHCHVNSCGTPSEHSNDLSTISDSVKVEVESEEEEEEDASDDESEGDDCRTDGTDIVASTMQQQCLPASIHMENSSNVHVGNRFNYNAPVTINNFVNVHKGQDGKEDVQTHSAIKIDPHTNEFLSGRCVDPTDDKEKICRLRPERYRQLLWGLVAAGIALLIIVALVLYFTERSSTRNNKPGILGSSYVSIPTKEPPPDVTPDPALTLNEEQQIYPRSYWSVYPPIFTRQLNHPTPYVVISHSVEHTCSEPIPCSETLRIIQNFHVSEFEQPDIGYNFMIDESGNVYEGRGWDHTNFFSEFVKRRNIGVCFLGNYVFLELSDKQQKALKDLLALGLRLKKLSDDYKLLAHSQIYATLSPGKNVLKVIDSWPHRCLSDCVIPFNTTTSTSTENSTELSTSTTDNSTSL